MDPKPFFAATPAAERRRHLLLVSYSFPPDSSIGALRWQKLVGMASEREWGVDVIMMDPVQSPVRDDSRLSELPAGTRLFGVRLNGHPYLVWERGVRRRLAAFRGRASDLPTATTAAGLTRLGEGTGFREWLRTLRRAQLARLDYSQWKTWADAAAALGGRLAESRRYDVIVTSGPPQMAHEAGRQIAVACHLPLVLDFRDLWAFDLNDAPTDLRGATWLRISRAAEAQCLAAASLIVANTEAAARKLAESYPRHSSRILTVMNGADPDIGPGRLWDERFTIFQGGGLYDGRDPTHLFRAVARVISSLGLTPRDLCVHFLGSTHYEDTPVNAIAAREGISAFYHGDGLRPRAEALQAMRRAAMLVLLPQNQHYCIPGKTFEYVQADAWLLALSPPESATAILLRDSSAIVVSPTDVDGIAQAIGSCYQAFVRGERPTAVNAGGRYDRERQARILFEALDSLTATRR